MYNELFPNQINFDYSPYLKDIGLNENTTIFIPNIEQDEEENGYNYIFADYFEKLESSISKDIPMEDKILFKDENNNENIFSLNEKMSEELEQKNDYIGKKRHINDDEIIFKKNRNNLNNNYFKITKDKLEKVDNNIYNYTRETSISNNNNQIEYAKNRTDSLLIKFKSFLGKCFINHINNKLKNLSKRRIKFYLLNYKKFTLNVNYNQNKIWLNEKMKDLLTLGDESNQEKNENSLKSLSKKKEIAFDEVKNLLEMTYKEIIEKFYLSIYFEKFKNNAYIKTLNEYFVKVKNISILEKNGFINFINKEKGNNKKIE